MNKSSISAQLQNDYPDYEIYLDTNNRMIVADNHKMSLLNSTSALEVINIFSKSGKSFYQAITQLLYSNFEILPEKGSYAYSLIILQEDLKKYKVQKLAKEWGIGFLEDNEDVLALEIEDGIKRDLLLESYEKDYGLDFVEEHEWAKLEEIDFNTEIAYMEKGLEFMTELEKHEDNKKAVQDKQLAKKVSEFHGRLNFIKRLFKR
jgi:hypothetical protein